MLITLCLVALLGMGGKGQRVELSLTAPGIVQFVVESDSAAVLEFARHEGGWPGTPLLAATAPSAELNYMHLAPPIETGFPLCDSIAVDQPPATVAGEGFFRSQHVSRVVIQELQRGERSWLFYPSIQVTLQFPVDAHTSCRTTDGLVERVLRPLLINETQSRFMAPFIPAPNRPSTPPPIPSCKVIVDAAGFYRISYNEFLAVGVDLSSVAPETFRIWYHGEEQAFRVVDGGDGTFDAGDYVLFFGHERHREDPAGREADHVSYYSQEATFWFSWGNANGMRWVEADGTPEMGDPPATWYWELSHAEEENTVFIAWHNEPLNNELEWYWQRLNASYALREFSVDTDAVAPADTFVLRTGIQGGSQGPGHHSEFYVSSTLVDSAWWGMSYGRDVLVYDSADSGLGVDLSLLQEPSTPIGLKELPDGPAGSGAYSYLNWIEVKYPRHYVARDSALSCLGPAGSVGERRLFRVRSFQDTETAIVNLTQDQWITGAQLAGDTLLFSTSTCASDEFHIQHISTITRVQSIVPYVPPEPPLDSVERAADYVVVTDQLLQAAADTLAQALADQYGWRTAVLDVIDVYDYFSYGEIHPRGIRDCMVCGYENWQAPQLSYALFLGDASSDFLGHSGPGTQRNLVPTWGNPGNDFYYARLTYDQTGEYDWIPDIATGRFPARTEDEAFQMVRKTLAYLDEPAGSKRLLLAAHGVDDYENLSFIAMSDDLFENFVPDELLAEKETVYADLIGTSGYRSYKDDFVTGWHNKPVLVHYIGRGGHYTWSMEYHVSMADTLGGVVPLPLLIGGSCNSGRFALPDSSCLAEVGLRAESLGRGPVGVISSTGITSTSQAYWWSRYALPIMLQKDPRSTIGEAHLSGTLIAGQFLAERYILLSDPAVRVSRLMYPDLTMPDDWLAISPSTPSEEHGEITLHVSLANLGAAAPPGEDSCQVVLRDSTSSGEVVLGSIRSTLPTEADTVIDFPWNPLPERGIHVLKVAVDEETEVDESNENNNSARSTVEVFFQAPQPYLPKDNALFVDHSVQMLVQTIPNEADVLYRFQWCRDPRFDGSGEDVIESELLSPGEYYTGWTAPNLPEETPIFWRCRAEDADTPGRWSETRSFEIDYFAMGPGWRQGHWGQFAVDSLVSCVMDSTESKAELEWSVGSDVALVDSGASVVSVSSQLSGFAPENLLGPHWFIFANNDLDQTAVIDLGRTRWLSALGTEMWAGPMDRGVWSLFELATSLDNLSYTTHISYGTFTEPSLEIPARAYVAVDEPLEARYIRARFGIGCPHPPVYWGSRIYEITTYPYVLASQGEVWTQEIGPAGDWIQCSVEATVPDEADSVLISVMGYATATFSWEPIDGYQELPAPFLQDLAAVDAIEYPWIRLVAKLSSSTEIGGPSLDSWEVLYVPR